MTNIFSEHHQDPLTCMEDSLAPNRIEPRVDNNEMVIADAAWEKVGRSPTEEVGLGGQDRRTGITQETLITSLMSTDDAFSIETGLELAGIAGPVRLL